MNYLIQNFQYQQKTIRGNLRVRSSFIARNFALIYLLLSSSSVGYNLLAKTSLGDRTILKVGDAAFNALSKVLFWKIKNLKFTPIGTNFPVSAHYTGVVGLDNLISKTPYSPNFPLDTGRFFNYPYFMGNPIAITPISGKTYSYALYKLLRMSLNMWFCWPRHYRISINHTTINSYWLILRFLNKYFFKLYNI